MKRIILILTFILGITSAGYSQIFIDKDGNIHDQRKTTTRPTTRANNYKQNKSSSSFDKSKLSIGGGIGVQFGDYTIISVTPQVGYDLSKNFTVGAGFGYTYFQEDYGDYEYKGSYLSFNLFGRFYPVDFLVIGIQPDISRMWRTIEYNRESSKESLFVPSLLLGGGVRLGGMTAMIQYDVVQDINTPYGDSFFYTIGYTFRF